MNHSLEQALSFADPAGDIALLKALARSESNRADLAAQLLIAVLRATGPVQINSEFQTANRNTGGYTLTQAKGGHWVVRSET